MIHNKQNHVVLFAYPIKLKISTENTVTKIPQKKLYCEFPMQARKYLTNFVWSKSKYNFVEKISVRKFGSSSMLIIIDFHHASVATLKIKLRLELGQNSFWLKLVLVNKTVFLVRETPLLSPIASGLTINNLRVIMPLRIASKHIR